MSVNDVGESAAAAAAAAVAVAAAAIDPSTVSATSRPNATALTPLHLLLNGMMSHDRAKVREGSARIREYLATKPDLQDPSRVPLKYPPQAQVASRATEEVLLITQLLSHNSKWASAPSGKDGSLPLHLAAHLGNLLLCKVIHHAHPAAVVAPNRKGKIPLHFAAREGHIDIVRFFLRACPAAASKASVKRKLPLHFSVSEGHLEISRLLLQAHADGASSLSSKGKLPLHLASRWGHVEIVKMLLRYYPLGARRLDWEGSLPLHDAALENHDDVVGCLVTIYPEGLRQCNIRGELPLFAAVRNNNVSMVYSMLTVYPEGGRIVLRSLNANDRVNCLQWNVLDLCLRGATGMLAESSPFASESRGLHSTSHQYGDRYSVDPLGAFPGVGVHPMATIPVSDRRTDVVLLQVQPLPAEGREEKPRLPHQLHHVTKTLPTSEGESHALESEAFCDNTLGNEIKSASVSIHEEPPAKRKRDMRCDSQQQPPAAVTGKAPAHTGTRTTWADNGKMKRYSQEYHPMVSTMHPSPTVARAQSYECEVKHSQTLLPMDFCRQDQHAPPFHWGNTEGWNVWRSPARHFFPLHAAISCRCSLSVLLRVLDNCTDQAFVVNMCGQLPLHLIAMLCQPRPTEDGTMLSGGDASLFSEAAFFPSRSKGSSKEDDYVEILSRLLRLYPDGALKRDNANRLPLHIALMNRASFRAVRLLLDVNLSTAYEVCGSHDDYRGHIPLVQAMANDCDLDVIYTLLRGDPTRAVNDFRQVGLKLNCLV